MGIIWFHDRASAMVRYVCSISCLMLTIMTAGGCDRMYRILQKEGAEEREILGEIVPFKPNKNVAEVQKLLKLYGYNIGNVDGKLGGNTRTAIAAFQRDNDLKVSRFVDYATWQRMHVFEEYGLVVDGDLNIKAVQIALKNAGFYSGKIDGKHGRGTEEAIQNFQKFKKLKPDGRIGIRTLNYLAEHIPLSGQK